MKKLYLFYYLKYSILIQNGIKNLTWHTHKFLCKFVYFDQNKNAIKNRIVGASGSSVPIKVSAFFSPTLPSLIPLLSSIHATSSHRSGRFCNNPASTPILRRVSKSKWFGYFWKLARGASLPSTSLQSDFPRTCNPEFDRSCSSCRDKQCRTQR